MTIKYSASHLSRLKTLLLLASFSIVLTSSAQIVGEDEKPIEDEKPKKEKVRTKSNRDSLTGTTYYLTGLYTYGFRKFEDQSPFQAFELWEDQTADYSGGFNFGLFLPMNDWLSLDLGFTYFGAKEQYNFVSDVSDSTYFFSQTYMHIGVPVKLRFTYGDRLQLFGFVGLTPMNLLNVRFNERYTTVSGASYEPATVLIKDKLAMFNLMGNVGVGVTYNFDWIGLTFYPEYRHNLLETYDSQKPLSHKMYGLGLNAGITLRF